MGIGSYSLQFLGVEGGDHVYLPISKAKSPDFYQTLTFRSMVNFYTTLATMTIVYFNLLEALKKNG